MKAFLVLLAVFAIANAATNVGIAHIVGTANDPTVTGTAYFVQLNDTHHWVWVSISGITVNPAADHGIHVHALGDITDKAAGDSAGGHFAGAGSTTHGCEDTDIRHEGDMGNWTAVAGAIGPVTKTLDLLATTGNNSIIGHAIVLHANFDNCVAQPTGGAGSRLAVGVIGISNPATWPQAILDALSITNISAVTNGAGSTATGVTRAVASLAPSPAFAPTSVTGNVTFEQDPTSGAVTVTGVFFGLTAGQAYGIHIHSFADWSGNGTAVGGHFGASSSAHGAPGNATRHFGDLGNICSYDSTNTTAYYRWVMTDGKFSLTGTNSILGRAVIVHAVYDTMLPSFSAFGNRLAQGIIGAANATLPAIITIPTAVNVSDPLCTPFAPPATTTTTAASTSTAAASTSTASATTSATATTRPATTASSSASLVAVCFTAMIAMFAVVLF